MNKRGFTLMELLVYMAIVGIIVLVAGRAYSDSTKMRIRTQSMIQANQVAENVGALLKGDISQMGAKSAYDSTHSSSTRDVFAFSDSVFMAVDGTNPDSSSFSLTRQSSGDRLTFRKLNYSETGASVRVEEISWYVTNGTLFRSCKTLSGEEDNVACPSSNANVVEVATGVENFELLPAKPSVLGGDGLIFPVYASDLNNKNFRLISRFGSDNFVRIVPTPGAGSSSIALSGFLSNYREDGAEVSDPVGHQVFVAETGTTGNSWENCKHITFKKDSTYEISFDMSNGGDESRMFQPEKDLFSLGLRITDSGSPVAVADVPDFHFYPPENDDGAVKRAMRFSVHSANVSACMAFSFSFFSPTASMGQITIANLRVYQVGEANYKFEEGYLPAVADKKNVRAFKARLTVKTNGEAGNAELVIPVPSNGFEE